MQTETPILKELLTEIAFVAGIVQSRIEIYRVEIDGAAIEGDLMAVTIKDNQKFKFKFRGKSIKGNPAPVENPQVTVNDPALGTAVLIDGETAEVAAVGPVGAFQVTLTADAQIGEGEKLKMGLIDVTVEASEAFTIDIIPEAPVDQ